MEIALDIAVQCSPDHPWLRQHPEWFRKRPDGTIRYAENPPKKYEDIVKPQISPATAACALWAALRDVIQFWVGQGVKISRQRHKISHLGSGSIAREVRAQHRVLFHAQNALTRRVRCGKIFTPWRPRTESRRAAAAHSRMRPRR